MQTSWLAFFTCPSLVVSMAEEPSSGEQGSMRPAPGAPRLRCTWIPSTKPKQGFAL